MSEQENPSIKARASDVESIDSIITALYEAISFPVGGEPDWDRIRSLFTSGGRLIPPRREGDQKIPVMDVEAFIEWGSRFMEENGMRESGFYENDVHRITERFGNVAHVFSTYESRFTANDPTPFERGINSIQLARDEGRWWVVTVFWDIESEDKPIPSKYLPESAQ